MDGHAVGGEGDVGLGVWCVKCEGLNMARALESLSEKFVDRRGNGYIVSKRHEKAFRP